MDGLRDCRHLRCELVLELLLEGGCFCHVAVLALGDACTLQLILETCVEVGGIRLNAKESPELRLDLVVRGSLPFLPGKTKDNRFFDELIRNGAQCQLRVLPDLAGCAANLLDELAQTLRVVADRVLGFVDLNGCRAGAIVVFEPFLADAKTDDRESRDHKSNDASGGIKLRATAEQLATDGTAFPFPGGSRDARPATPFRHGGQLLLRRCWQTSASKIRTGG